MDMVLLQFHAQAVGEGIEGELGAGIGCNPGNDNLADNRGDIDDLAATLPLHVRNDGLDGVDGPQPVCGNQLIQMRDRDFCNAAVLSNSGVVDQHVDSAESLRAQAGHLLNLDGVGDVGFNRNSLGTQGVRQGLQLIDGARRQRQAGSFGGEEPGGRGPDAAGGAGNDDNFIFQFPQGISPCAADGVMRQVFRIPAAEYNSSMKELLLPLFPLPVVLFPGAILPLHIFEDRYKQMIGECLENQWEFGVVLVRKESLETTGCTALIAEVVRKYDDGRMDIRVRGVRRFEILLLNRENAYLRARCQFVVDEEAAVLANGTVAAEAGGENTRRREAIRLYKQAVEFLPQKEPPAAEQQPDWSAPELSFQLMSRLPADLALKQALLQMRSEEQRLAETISYLKNLLGHLTRVANTRAKAGSNGQCR